VSWAKFFGTPRRSSNAHLLENDLISLAPEILCRIDAKMPVWVLVLMVNHSEPALQIAESRHEKIGTFFSNAEIQPIRGSLHVHVK